MKKTKLISHSMLSEFEIELNEFLVSINARILIDIKFSTAFAGDGKPVLFSALVIYEEND